MARWTWLFWLIAAASCLVLIGASTILTPISNDAGVYLTMADGILAGKLPYRDLFDHKPPGTYYLFAGALALSNRSLLAVQAVQVLGVLATATLTGWLAYRLWQRSTGLLAGLLTLYGAVAFYGTHLTTELWVGLGTVAALCWLCRNWPQRHPNTRDWFIAGLLVGSASLFKQVGLLVVPALAAWVPTTVLLGDRRGVFWRWLGLTLGLTLPLAVTGLYFVGQGAWQDLWRDVVLVNFTSYPPHRPGTLLVGNLVNLRAFPLLWIGLALALVYHPPRWQHRPGSVSSVVLLLWLVLACSALPLLFRSYGHYLLHALPIATMLAAAGLTSFWQWVAPQRRRVVAITASILLLAAAIDVPAWPRYLAHTQQLVERQQAVAAYIQAQTTPDQEILTLSVAPQYYFLSARTPATRWIYLYPVSYRPDRELALLDLLEEREVSLVLIDDSIKVPWHSRLSSAVEAACQLDQSFGDDLRVFHCL